MATGIPGLLGVPAMPPVEVVRSHALGAACQSGMVANRFVPELQARLRWTAWLAMRIHVQVLAQLLEWT